MRNQSVIESLCLCTLTMSITIHTSHNIDTDSSLQITIIRNKQDVARVYLDKRYRRRIHRLSKKHSSPVQNAYITARERMYDWPMRVLRCYKPRSIGRPAVPTYWNCDISFSDHYLTFGWRVWESPGTAALTCVQQESCLIRR